MFKQSAKVLLFCAAVMAVAFAAGALQAGFA